jgi:hypothetical protein
MMRALPLTSPQLLAVAFSLFALGACEQQARLRVDKVEPDQGVLGGGERVTIRGAGFQPGKTQVEVRFGRRRAESVTISSASTISVVTPPGQKGPVDVTLLFDDGAKFRIPEGYKYLAPTGDSDMRKAFFSGQGQRPSNAPAPK